MEFQERERFGPGELAVVLSHYDVGVIESARELPRGSRKSPKLLLQAAAGRYLLKRRAHGTEQLGRAEFSHVLLSHLRVRRFPVPRAVPTRDTGDTLLAIGGRVYELFEYVEGERFDGSLEAAFHAGKTLARFHRAVQEIDTAWHPPAISYHDARPVRSGLNAIPTTTASHDSVVGHEAELLAATQELYERYDEACEQVEKLGFGQWEPWIVHGDWHPGNMRFRRGRVVAVLDFDAVRLQPRVSDLANAMLQFSILRGAGDPMAWPAFFDEARMRRVLLGYLSKMDLDEAQRRAIPALMLESMIAECVVPIAATGSFGQMPGFGVIQMVRRKVRWLLENRSRIDAWILE